MFNLEAVLYAIIAILAVSTGSLLKIVWDKYTVRREEREQGSMFER